MPERRKLHGNALVFVVLILLHLKAAYDVILTVHQKRDVAKLPSFQEIFKTIDSAMYALNRMETAIQDKAIDKPSTSKSHAVEPKKISSGMGTANSRILVALTNDPKRRWTVKAMAQKIGCHEGTVKRSPNWKRWRNAGAATGRIRRGSKTNGDIEAVDDE